MFNYLFYVDYKNNGTFEDPIVSRIVSIDEENYKDRKYVIDEIIKAEEENKRSAERVLAYNEAKGSIIRNEAKDYRYALRRELQRGTNGSTSDNGSGLRDGRGTGRTGREFNKIKWATINDGYLKELNRGNNSDIVFDELLKALRHDLGIKIKSNEVRADSPSNQCSLLNLYQKKPPMVQVCPTNIPHQGLPR